MTSTLQTFVVGDGEDAITYDVRGDLTDGTPGRPVLMIIGSPMDASGFTTLAGHFADRPVVTYDPRGSGRNPTGTTPVLPEQHAEDVHRVIAASGVGPVDLFASSGGAVNALALTARHPEDLRRVVAHEPPTAALLPDREVALAAIDQILAAYRNDGTGPAMAQFITLVMARGELDAGYLGQPAPDPATVGLPAADDGDRSNPLMRNMPAGNTFLPDAEALAHFGERLTIAVGVESGAEMAARGGRSVAALLGLPVTAFPGGHNGFLGGEFGQRGEPTAFAARLREVLS